MLKFALKDGKTLELPTGEAKTDKAKRKLTTKYLADTWRNSGVMPDGEELTWNDLWEAVSPKKTAGLQDLTSLTEIRALLPTITETIIREPIEPLLVIANLFTPIRSLGLQTHILLGAIGGSFVAGDADEGGNYPEASFEMGGGISISTVGKSGIQAAFTDEALRYSTWDIMAINLRMMASAVARHTEFKAISFLLSMGQVIFDNADPTSSLLGVTTGRDMSGAANGTITMDDLMDAYTHGVEVGYPPDLLLMSPQMYFMWVRDPVLRHLFLQGNGGVFFATYTGNPAVLPNWSNGALGGQGPSNGYAAIPAGAISGETATPIEQTSQRATSAPVIPGYLGFPLRIIVSPLIPYDPATKLGTIFLLSSGMIGYHLIDEEMNSVEWRDEDREIVKIKMRQRDSFAVANDGLGICVFRNIKNDRNFYHGDIELHQTVSGTITEIDRDTAVV